MDRFDQAKDKHLELQAKAKEAEDLANSLAAQFDELRLAALDESRKQPTSSAKEPVQTASARVSYVF